LHGQLPRNMKETPWKRNGDTDGWYLGLLTKEIIAATQDQTVSTNYFKRNILRNVTNESPLWKGYEEITDHPTSGRRELEVNKYIIRRKKRPALIWLNVQGYRNWNSNKLVLTGT
jgi:hypothetical protein